MDDQTYSDTLDTSASTPPDWISLARDAYSASSNWFDASVRKQVESDLRQFQGQHPFGSKYLAEAHKGRSKLFRPKTRTTIRKNEAAAAQAFFSSLDVVNVTAGDEDDMQQQASAAVMGALLQYRLTKSIPWFMILIGAYQDAQTVGVVASYQYWQYDATKGIDRPAVRLIPVENLRVDPGADWTDPIGTSPYVIELIPMYVKDVKARMRTVDPKTGDPKWKTLPDSTILSATRTYGDSIRLQREAPRPDSKYQQQANSNYTVVWVHKNIVDIDGVDYVYYTLGCEYLLSDPVPLSQVYFHGVRPYAMGSCVIETHKMYPSSVPRLTRDVQAEINEVANQRIDNVKLAMNKRYFARRNKQVDLRSVTRNVPGSVTLVQDIDDVKVVEFNDVTGSSYKEQEVLNLDFDDVSGTFSGSSVQSNRKLNETVGGMQMLDAGANQVSGYQLRTFVETWVEPVLRQLVLLEQHYETDDAILALCGKTANLQQFGVDAITDDQLMHEFSVNVNVGMGAVNPTEQVQQFIQGMTALGNMLENQSLVQLGLNTEEVIKELFGKLGYKDGARFFKLDGTDPQVQELQQQVQQLQQQLAQKTDPQLVAAQIRKIDAEIASLGVKDKATQADAIKKGSEAQFSAMQTAEVIAAVPAVAPIADELMRAAGYRPSTPAGTEPGFPQPGAPAAGLSTEAIKNHRTGVDFMPGQALPGQGPSTTMLPKTPLPPMPATPGTGERRGIETTRPDSVIGQAAYANGGVVGMTINGLTDADNRAQRYASDPVGPTISGLTDDDMPSAAPRPARRAPVPLPPPIDDDTFANGGLVGQENRNQAILGALARIGSYHDTSDAYADGGAVQGPGSGTSDSIPAVIDGARPARISNGEYVVPAAVVQALGEDFFDHLVQQLHVPAQGQPGAPADVEPVGLQGGDYIIPADVVKALGRDFFDKLVENYNS